MLPVLAATSISYCAHSFEHKGKCDVLPSTPSGSFSGGGHWEPLPELEVDSREGGIHALPFVDHGAKRAIIAFRGSCMEHEHKECRADACVLDRWQTQGAWSRLVFGNEDANSCWSFSAAQLDYLAQAENVTTRIQQRLPGYAVLLVGHSLGGFLSMLTAMKQPETLQALTFSPSPFHTAALQSLGLTEDQLDSLAGTANRVALGDPYDLIVNTIEVPLARKGTLSCVYDDWDAVEPTECKYANQMLKDRMIMPIEFPFLAICKKAAHNWDRYTRLIQQRKANNVTPLVLPNCSRQFSIISTELLDTMNL